MTLSFLRTMGLFTKSLSIVGFVAFLVGDDGNCMLEKSMELLAMTGFFKRRFGCITALVDYLEVRWDLLSLSGLCIILQ